MSLVNYSKQLQVTELDFGQIKQNLKDYFKRSDSKFKDWDWEGSGLSTLLDILAYNTHYNAMLAHTSFNESFIDSAQLRASVVSHGKLLGYVPRSRTSSKASVILKSENQFGVTRNTAFTSKVGNQEYTFAPLDAVTSYLDSQEDLYVVETTIQEGA